MTAEQRIIDLGYELPVAAAPAAMYVPVKRAGSLIFAAGQIPVKDGALAYRGKVGKDVSLEEAQEAAKLCTLNLLAALKHALGDLDEIRQVLKIQIFVNSVVGFDQQHIVANAASQLLYDIFGEDGMHARTAVGTNQLPMDAPVEVEAILEAKSHGQ